MKVKLLSRLCDPMDCSLPGSSLHGILQAVKVLRDKNSSCVWDCPVLQDSQHPWLPPTKSPSSIFWLLAQPRNMPWVGKIS